MADLYIATEDRLSEALAECIVIATGHAVARKDTQGPTKAWRFRLSESKTSGLHRIVPWRAEFPLVDRSGHKTLPS